MTGIADQPLIQDIRRYLAVAHKRRGLLLTAVGLSLLVAVLYNYTTRPVYQATVQILIDKAQPKVLPGSQMVDPGLQDMQTEYELLRGRALAERLVERAGAPEERRAADGADDGSLGALPAPVPGPRPRGGRRPRRHARSRRRRRRCAPASRWSRCPAGAS